MAREDKPPSILETFHWVRQQNIWRYRSKLADDKGSDQSLIRQLLAEEEARDSRADDEPAHGAPSASGAPPEALPTHRRGIAGLLRHWPPRRRRDPRG